MRIKATEMERMFGMSANGIRLYEKHGIISPQRDVQSRYRVYGADEMQAMGCGIQYRRYGFTMQETARLLCGADEEQQLEAMQRREEELEQEIERLRLVRKSLRVEMRRARQAMSLLNCCVVEEKPAMYFLGSMRGESLLGEESDGLVGEWIDRYAPHLSSAMLLDGPYFTQEGYEAEPLSGVAVDAEMALELGLRPNEYVTYLPPKPCVVTALRIKGRPDFGPVAQRVRRFARENGIELHAGGVIRLVRCVREEGSIVTTGMLWAPLRSDERRFGKMR